MQVYVCVKDNMVEMVSLDLGLAMQTVKEKVCDKYYKVETDLTYEELTDLLGLHIDDVINDCINIEMAKIMDKYDVDIQYTWDYKEWLYLEEI